MCIRDRLSLKNSFRGGAFIGCSNYPECKFTRPLSKSKAAQQLTLAEPKLIGQNDFGKDIYVKKIGSVAKENLNISIQGHELCNLRVDQLTKKFNNSISSCF